LQPALHVGAFESQAGMGEAVEVGGLDDWITQRGDGVGSLVIGKEEEDVGLGRLRHTGGECGFKRKRRQK
jgi:hypothetical protein